MKKIVLMVAVMMIAAPAMAQVDFTIGPGINPGEVVIGYTNTGDGSPNNRHPRGIAIEVEITYGDATFLAPVNPTISGPSNAFVSTGGEYNCYIDYLHTNGGGLGDGHPLAEPDHPGVYTGTKDDDEQRLAISLGFLDTGNGQAAQTAATVTNLVTLLLTPGDDPNAMVTISADTTRAGIGASGVVGSNVPSTFPPAAHILFVVPLLTAETAIHPDTFYHNGINPGTVDRRGTSYYQYWLDAGSPDCWAYPRQCHGDANGEKVGDEWVGRIYVQPDDLNPLLAGWLVYEPNPTNPWGPAGPGLDGITDLKGTEAICADFDHFTVGDEWVGRIRLTPGDLNILLSNWLVYEPNPTNPWGPAGPGVPADCGGTYDPTE